MQSGKNNEERIKRQLNKYLFLPDGLIHRETSLFNHIYIFKEQNQLQLYTSDLKYPLDKPLLSGAMSRIDLLNPFYLVAWYTRSLLISSVWLNKTNKVYVLGFGGGRIPMILLNYFPEVFIESTEIDPNIIRLSKEYFGIFDDERLVIINEDGGLYLSNQPMQKYDIIMIDCFTGSGEHPIKFSDTSFYRECIKHLVMEGVVCTNLHEQDVQFNKKRNNFIESFIHVMELSGSGCCVLFGWFDDSMTPDLIKMRIQQMDTQKKWKNNLTELLKSAVFIK